jgi:hypothetical protein
MSHAGLVGVVLLALDAELDHSQVGPELCLVLVAGGHGRGRLGRVAVARTGNG